MVYFFIPWVVLVIAVVVNVLVDRHPLKRTSPRVVEIALLWVVVGLGAWGLIGALGHVGPTSGDVAAGIGYQQSMFQWEVGFGDFALCALGIASFWFRDRWLTAGVVALAISYGGDAVGHIMEVVAHNNMAPDNTWAIPSDILQPLLAIVLLIAYRRGLGRLPTGYRHGVLGDTADERTASESS